MTRRWHCDACQVEWWTTDPTCWSCGGQGRAGGFEPVVKKSPSALAAERAWRLASGLGSVPVPGNVGRVRSDQAAPGPGALTVGSLSSPGSAAVRSGEP